jgi:hypothetical protein
MDPTSPWAFAGALLGGGVACLALFRGAVYLASLGLDSGQSREASHNPRRD